MKVFFGFSVFLSYLFSKYSNTLSNSTLDTSKINVFDLVFECALDIIRYNEEEEEKQRLYQLKIKELQELFQKEPLNKLKELNLIDYGQTHIGMVGETDGEGQSGDREPQETND